MYRNRLCIALLISLLLCFRVSAQMGESPYRLSNTDTTELLDRIDTAEKVAKQYPDSALKMYREIIRFCKAISFNRGTILAYVRAGNTLCEQGHYYQALHYFKNALTYCKGTEDYLNAMLYNNIGSAYAYLAQYELATRAFLKGAAYSGKYAGKGVYPLEAIYFNLASAPLMKSGQYDKVLNYLNLAYKISLEKRNYERQAQCLIHMGIAYYSQGNYSQSQLMYDSGIALAQKFHIPDALFHGYANSANLYLQTGEIGTAINQLHHAHLLIGNNSYDIYKKVSTYLLLGKAYTRNREYDSAQYWLDRAWAIALPLPHKRAELLKYYAELYEVQGKNREANQKLNAFIRLKDSISNNERSYKIAQLETEYRTAEKDKELAQNQLQLNQKEHKLRTAYLFLASGITVSLLLILSLLLYRVNTKNKQKQMQQEAAIRLLEAAMESEQKERSRIAMELHDGIVSHLTAIKLNLEITQPDPRYTAAYKENLDHLGMTILDVRNTAHNLMPEILIRHHPEKAIELLCNLIEKTGKLQVQFLSYGDFSEIKPEMGLAVYRIVQELLHNIIKHASAEKALVQMSCYNRILTLTVEDNGKGIKKHKSTDKGLGMRSIEKRVKAWEGHISYGTPGPDSGTTIDIELEIKD